MHFMRFATALVMALLFGACSEGGRPSVAGVTSPAQLSQGGQPAPAPARKKIALVMKIAPGDSVRLVPVLKSAQDSGIQIVNIDNRLEPETMKKQGLAHVPFISVDNEKAAYESARFIAQSVQKPTQAAILEGIRSADNARLRKNGAERAFKENPLITVVAMETANWKIDEGYEVTRQLFAAHPDIGLLFCANDMMALGALKSLQESGRQGVKVAAYDALEDAREAVKSGRLAATVDQQAAEQGYQGVLLARRAIDGESVPELTVVETRLVTAETLK